MASTAPIHCEEALRLLAQYLDQELCESDRDHVDRHLRTCRSCYSRAEFERRLKEQLTRLRAAPVPERLARRIQLLLGESA
jgi:anti-sigma factor (TIGR02949 family)